MPNLAFLFIYAAIMFAVEGLFLAALFMGM